MQLSMEKEKDRYHYPIVIKGDSMWQKIVLTPSDFKKRAGETPKDWADLDFVISLPAGWEWEDLEMRNLKWIK